MYWIRLLEKRGTKSRHNNFLLGLSSVQDHSIRPSSVQIWYRLSMPNDGLNPMTTPTPSHTESSKQMNQTEIDEFVYIVSHDLKEPLRGIVTYISFLFEDHPELLESEAKDRLEKIDQLSRHMSTMIDALTTYSRVGRYDQPQGPINVVHLLTSLIEEIQAETPFDTARITISETITEGLPEIVGKPNQIKSIFDELIRNGLTFNDHLPKDRHISIEAEMRDDALAFCIADNGIGIPERYHDRVFKLFKGKLHRNRYGNGVGLGLARTKKIVEQSNGRIWVESELGLGSRFWFTLPNSMGHSGS